MNFEIGGVPVAQNMEELFATTYDDMIVSVAQPEQNNQNQQGNTCACYMCSDPAYQST